MVFAPPSSVGDIIAIITLIAQVISTIANSGEQLKEYGSLILELKELMRVFEKVEEIGKLSLSSEALAIYLAIMEHVIQSKMTIKVFQRKKYLPKKWYRKLIWSFLAGSRADSLRRKLFTQRVAVDTYLSLFILQHHGDKFAVIAKTTASSHAAIMDIRLKLDTILNLQPTYGQILLFDATGTPLGVPVWLCSTTNLLRDVIKVYYTHYPWLPGSKLVAHGDYQLIYGKSGTELCDRVLNNIRGSSGRVEMRMIVHLMNHKEQTCVSLQVSRVTDRYMSCAICCRHPESGYRANDSFEGTSRAEQHKLSPLFPLDGDWKSFRLLNILTWASPLSILHIASKQGEQPDEREMNAEFDQPEQITTVEENLLQGNFTPSQSGTQTSAAEIMRSQLVDGIQWLEAFVDGPEPIQAYGCHFLVTSKKDEQSTSIKGTYWRAGNESTGEATFLLAAHCAQAWREAPYVGESWTWDESSM